MTTEVYTRLDLQNLHVNYIEAIRNKHIDAAIQYIKERVLHSATIGIECTLFRRIAPFKAGQSFSTRGILKANGLLEDDTLALECIGDIQMRLMALFPDSRIHFYENALYIGWQ